MENEIAWAGINRIEKYVLEIRSPILLSRSP